MPPPPGEPCCPQALTRAPGGPARGPAKPCCSPGPHSGPRAPSMGPCQARESPWGSLEGSLGPARAPERAVRGPGVLCRAAGPCPGPGQARRPCPAMQSALSQPVASPPSADQSSSSSPRHARGAGRGGARAPLSRRDAKTNSKEGQAQTPLFRQTAKTARQKPTRNGGEPKSINTPLTCSP